MLRHTFATYHYAQHADRAKLQAMMGHSEDEDTLDQHYRAVLTTTGKTVSRRLAAGFWGLTPRQVRLSVQAASVSGFAGARRVARGRHTEKIPF